MFNREDILARPTYWLTETQLDLARLVSDYLAREGMSVEELVVKSDTSFHHVNRLLRGDFNGSLENMTKVLTAMGVLLAPSFLSIEEYERERALESEAMQNREVKEGCCQPSVYNVALVKPNFTK
jgi:transcriptional regulator with XRE-family HTH domain